MSHISSPLAPRSIVHIGFHKTGTTSLQAMLGAHRSRLAAHGVAFYAGAILDHNHVELHVAAMRPERMSPFKLGSGLAGTAEYRSEVRAAIAAFATRHASERLVFSAEGLSYIRYEDELRWLSETIPQPAMIVACLRNKADYLDSYRAEMRKHAQPSTIDKDSWAYTGEDSWLLDYESRLEGFRAVFGSSNVDVVDYDREVAERGTILPAMLSRLGIEHAFEPGEIEAWYLNKRSG